MIENIHDGRKFNKVSEEHLQTWGRHFMAFLHSINIDTEEWKKENILTDEQLEKELSKL